MTAEEDFRRLLDRFGAARVRMDVEAGLYSPTRLAWARAWLTNQNAACASARPAPRAAVGDTGSGEIWEARRLAGEANELSAEANRMAREAKLLARSSKATARTARLVAVIALTAGIGAAGAVAAFALHLF